MKFKKMNQMRNIKIKSDIIKDDNGFLHSSQMKDMVLKAVEYFKINESYKYSKYNADIDNMLNDFTTSLTVNEKYDVPPTIQAAITSYMQLMRWSIHRNVLIQDRVSSIFIPTLDISGSDIVITFHHIHGLDITIDTSNLIDFNILRYIKSARFVGNGKMTDVKNYYKFIVTYLASRRVYGKDVIENIITSSSVRNTIRRVISNLNKRDIQEYKDIISCSKLLSALYTSNDVEYKLYSAYINLINKIAYGVSSDESLGYFIRKIDDLIKQVYVSNNNFTNIIDKIVIANEADDTDGIDEDMPEDDADAGDDDTADTDDTDSKSEEDQSDSDETQDLLKSFMDKNVEEDDMSPYQLYMKRMIIYNELVKLSTSADISIEDRELANTIATSWSFILSLKSLNKILNQLKRK